MGASPNPAITGEQVQLLAQTTGGRAPFTYDWDYGDGSAHGSGPSPTHIYTTAGPKTITLSVLDANGRKASASLALVVEAPLAAAISPASPIAAKAGILVALSASASGGTAPYAYAWTFGDATGAAGQAVSHAYAMAGNYQVSLTVTDAQGRTASAAATVHVALNIVLPGSQLLYRTAAQIQAGVTLSSSWLNANNSPIIGGTPPYHTTWTGDDYTHVLADGVGITHASNVVYYFGSHDISLAVTDAAGHQGDGIQVFDIEPSAPA